MQECVDKKPDFSLIIACYCEEPHLFANIRQLTQYLVNLNLSCELVFIEDHSPDGTVDEIKKCLTWLETQPIATVARYHQTNLGRGASVQEGFRLAQGDVVGFIDIDLENLPDALLAMFLKIKAGNCDGIVARRLYQETRVNPIRNIASRFYRILAHLILTLPVSDTEAGLKLFNRLKILPVLDDVHDHGWFWDTEIVHQAALHGLTILDHPIVFVRNPDKKSTVHIIRDSLVYLKTLLKYRRRIAVSEGVPSKSQAALSRRLD